MSPGLIGRGIAVGRCGACQGPRGCGEADHMEGAHPSSMAELAEWTAWADKVIVF